MGRTRSGAGSFAHQRDGKTWSGVLPTTPVLLMAKVPRLKMPPPERTGRFPVTLLLAIVSDCPFQIPPPLPVATLPSMTPPSMRMVA